ncbi:MAG TPA: isochorismatase family protein, partial [Candidatus Acidoferrales bacterium]|nr:isochorismatase family protein [Candidatus Acidoferrales bacterium]
MAITRLDPNAALVLIDLQKGIVGFPTAHPMNQIIGRGAQLARVFRERGLPLVLVNVTGMAPGRTEVGRPKFAFPEGWTELVPELEQQPSDFLVSKER